MTKLLATCAAAAVTAAFALPAPASAPPRSAPMALRNADQVDASVGTQRAQSPPLHVHRYYGPRYGYRTELSAVRYYAPYYAYAPPYYRPYYGPGCERRRRPVRLRLRLLVASRVE